MTAAMTDDQVTALAPDASSLSAARKLANRWQGTGYLGNALWGLCQGSGAKPYQTIVDLAGPAYKCSCPSRKFPCKHALSLLLNYAQGRVDEATGTADFAAQWLAERTARAAKPATATARTANPATAEQRRVRVTAGLEELDIWLGDQVRTGLAQTDRSYTAFEAVAARMVDAQAPGIASALRRLPSVVVTRPDWPEIVLREFAGMHLLVAAHRRLDELTPALRASVRGHIGYPVPAETVRTEPAVRDRWMVLGVRISEEERLHTRRIWLYGRETGRWALIVDHSFGSPSFPAEIPPPGLLAEADVHYYPGAAPLRALWGTRYSAAEPFTTLPGADATIDTAATQHARAVGADPWLRSWPVLLTDVIPLSNESGWYIVESDGRALPLAVTDQPWRLLGISGGHPVTLAAEWTREGLVPISVFTAGEVIDLDHTDPTGRAIPNSPAAPGPGAEDLTSAALLGTARRTPDRTELAPPVAAAASHLRTDPALLLLEYAALQDTFGRGSVVAGTASTPEPAEDDPRPLLPRLAAARLARMLRDKSAFLPEWFAAAAPHDYRAPDALCGQLLDFARGNLALREPLLRLAGARGRWLASRHPEWRNLVRRGDSVPAEEIWRLGQPPERRDWLATLRHRDPAAARATLTAAWKQESGPLKAELIGVLTEGISAADEPLLETALDDRRADVRRIAASLLTRLPDAEFGLRMTARARAWVRAERSRQRAARATGPEEAACVTTEGPARAAIQHWNFVIDIPDALDDAARRDGITDRTVEFSYRWGVAPDVTAGRLRQLVAATPLAHWETALEVLGARDAATRVVDAGVPDRFRQPLFDGWIDAALAQRNSRWAAALFGKGVPSDLAMLRRRELFALLAPEDRTRHLCELNGSWLSEIEALLPAMGPVWPEPVARHLILLLAERARVAAKRHDAHSAGPNAHQSLLAMAAVHLPLVAVNAVAVVARRCESPAWEQAFDHLVHDLNHRSMMLEELQ
ncbi:SWIM zinc finger family protein [Nocardia sp. NPDC052566]|uniref:SWIM zinc finger family protein n=1 Tax=Nocardia sp. NPDC052566 TaxID=3364330 RepID=UPI0037C90045